MDSLQPRKKELVRGPQVTDEGARSLTPEESSLLFLVQPCVLTNSGTHFSLPWQNFVKPVAVIK